MWITREQYREALRLAGCPMCGYSLNAEGAQFRPCSRHREQTYPHPLTEEELDELTSN